MKRIYMAGVATADMFAGKDLFATAKTLTESSISISTSSEDIRGGEGAALLGKYYHTSAFDLTLTDALFSLDYLAKSVGANIEAGSDISMEDEATCTTAGEITLKKVPVKFTDCTDIYVYVKEAKEDAEYASYKVDATNAAAKKVVDDDFKVGVKYCVKYFYNSSSAREIVVRSNYVPATFHVVLKVNLYTAGKSDANATKAGYLLIDIPRFQLDGSQDLSMSMTGASTTSLKGSALATEGCVSGNCNSDNYYATITEVLTDSNWAEDAVALAVDGGDIFVEKPESGVTDNKVDVGDSIYVIFKSGAPKKLSAITDAEYKVQILASAEGISVDTDNKTLIVKSTYGGNATAKITVEGMDSSLDSVEVMLKTNAAG